MFVCLGQPFMSSKASNVPVKSISTLLSLLHESINSTAMVRHTIDIIKRIFFKINPSQCPMITADQPVYTLGKQIQWLYPDQYGEDKLVMMMGALHIEMAFLNAIGDWLEGSGWTDMLVKANISTPGANSFLSGRHVKRSRYAHQVTCAGLHLLCMDAYQGSQSNQSFAKWMKQKRGVSLQFQYWLTTMDREE